MIKIVFVEDNRMVAKIWKSGLERAGFEVEAIGCGDV